MIVPRLLSAYLSGTKPQFVPPSSNSSTDAAPPPIDRQLVLHQFAARTQPDPAGPGGDDIQVHPDILFALRLTTQPASAKPTPPP